jgi:hypothetical protein
MAEEAVDLDSIVAATETSTNNEIPMGETAPAEAAPQAPQEYAFQHNGQEIKAPIDKVLRWAQQGYSAPQRIGELSQKLKDYEGKFKNYEGWEKTYAPIDKWAKENPDKWQALFDGWQRAQFGGVSPDGNHTPPAALPKEVLDKLNQHDQFIQSQQQERAQERERRADHALDTEITSLRKQYSNIDFDAPDESGRTLEYRVLEHATRMGIPSFEAAFLHFNKAQLQQMYQGQGRERAAMSPQTKDALLGKNLAAKGQGPQVSELIKGRNLDQIHELVLQEMGLG